jgi:hypothetical protein
VTVTISLVELFDKPTAGIVPKDAAFADVLLLCVIRRVNHDLLGDCFQVVVGSRSDIVSDELHLVRWLQSNLAGKRKN